MKEFMDKEFLLKTETAKKLFHSFAENEPIFDWHCHLSAKEIYENKNAENLYELWLTGDHYKWRLMRGFGIDEKYITGDASPYEKFEKFAEALPFAVGNPVYHWSHLELQRYFGIYTPLSAKTAKEIWDEAERKIKNGGFSPREIIEKSNVFALCTTDDPCDDLYYHKKLKEDGFKVKVLPAFRPDKALAIENDGFGEWVKQLEKSAEMKIDSFSDLCTALSKRMDYFKENGTVASDQSVSSVVYAPASEGELDAIFVSAMSGKKPSKDQENKFKYALLVYLGKQYAKRGFAMELHLGAMRNNNTKMFNRIGADTGFDSIGDESTAHGLSRLLDELDKDDSLPKTVLFNLNPRDNYILGTMLGNFQSAQAKSKIQFGSAWWFNDNIDGMTAQLKTLGNLGVLGAFVGMVTDSRSFLSYPRHEYFRRILCNLVGSFVEDGLYPNDEQSLEAIIKGVAFTNAKDYFFSE